MKTPEQKYDDYYTDDSFLDITPHFKFFITPCPAPRMTQSDKWKTDPRKRQRECVRRYFNFKTEVVWTAKKINYKLEGELNIIFIIPMPVGWSEKKKIKMDEQPHQIRPDCDNFCKAWLDSFGIDDGFVWNIHAIKIWGRKGQIIIY